jgi:HD superfamily phosphodiesterase
MNLKLSVESAELQFKQILEDFFVAIYDEKSLSSHGIDHHRRVWNNAKELLAIKSETGNKFPFDFTSKLIIACYLHDIGMSVDSGIRHGRHSRNLCADFLSKCSLPLMEFEDLLETIENHDNKEYTGNSEGNELLTILSVADDLDAFGFWGIYRYSEIYLIRGIRPDLLGEKIIENAAKRFDHFKRNFGSNNSLVHKHQDRFNILIRFFKEFNKQVNSYHFDGHQPQGFCGVIEMFIEMIKNKKGLNEIYYELEKYPDDQVIQWFFNGLKKEIM